MKRNYLSVICAALCLGLLTLSLAGCTQLPADELPGAPIPEQTAASDIPSETAPAASAPSTESLSEPGMLLDMIQADGLLFGFVFARAYVYYPDALSISTKEQAEVVFERYRDQFPENCGFFSLSDSRSRAGLGFTG